MTNDQFRRDRAATGGPARPVRSAFTLVEVLVSLAIFAVAAVVLGTAYVNVLAGYHGMRGHAAAQEDMAFARAQLLAEPVRETAEKGGQLRMADAGQLRWQAKIEETERADLFDVILEYEIAPPGSAPVRRERQSFRLLRPTWSDPAKREELRAAFRKAVEKERS